MPACYQLALKTEPKSFIPVTLQSVDEAMCKHFNMPCDEKLWFRNWNNWLGFSLAVGRTFDQIRETFCDEGHWEVIDWIEKNYEVSSFYQSK